MSSKKLFVCDVCGKKVVSDMFVPAPADWFSVRSWDWMADTEDWDVCSLACLAKLVAKMQPVQS